MGESHYERVDDLTTAILDGLGHLDQVSLDDLAPVDEFHLGGAAATAAVIDALGVGVGDRVIDIGSGIGGPARRIADATGCHVTGVDMTPSFVQTAAELSRLVGLDDRTEFHLGDATALDLADGFDAATLIHVGMNIEDKAALFASVHGLLAPGARFVVYDLMAIGDTGGIDYPMPFASTADESFVASPDAYTDALTAAGFTIGAVTDHTQLALDAAATARAGGPPPVSLATLMGPDFATMFANLGATLRDGIIAPTQVVASR